MVTRRDIDEIVEAVIGEESERFKRQDALKVKAVDKLKAYAKNLNYFNKDLEDKYPQVKVIYPALDESGIIHKINNSVDLIHSYLDSKTVMAYTARALKFMVEFHKKTKDKQTLRIIKNMKTLSDNVKSVKLR